MSPLPPKSKPQQAPKQNKEYNSNKTTGIIIALLIVCAAAGYFLYPVIKKTFDKKPVTVIQEEPQPELVPVDTTQKIAIAEPAPHKTESSASVPKGYYIIVGSYHQKYNANNLTKKLKKDIDLNILYFEELGLYRVSAGKYDNIHQAYNDMYSVKDIDGCTNAWVLENK